MSVNIQNYTKYWTNDKKKVWHTPVASYTILVVTIHSQQIRNKCMNNNYVCPGIHAC